MDKQTVTCIVCPRSCRVTVTEGLDGLSASGYGCKRGLDFAGSEVTCPMRMLTSTVAITGAALRRLPVVTSAEVPKSRLSDCLQAVYALRAQAPVHAGDVLVRDLCGTGADLVATRSMAALGKR